MIASFDIGIKNLAYCILEKHAADENEFEIRNWGVWDLSVAIGAPTTSAVDMISPKPKCSLCKNFATHFTSLRSGGAPNNEKTYLCRTHTLIAAQNNTSRVLKTGAAQKWLRVKKSTAAWKKKFESAFGENIFLDAKEDIKTALMREFYLPISATMPPTSSTEKSRANGTDLISAGRRMTAHLDTVFTPALVSQLREVRIENQIGPLATRMKTMQGMLTQYFIVRAPEVSIRYISARQKLTASVPTQSNVVETTTTTTTSTESYRGRKKQGILLCRQRLQHSRNANHWVQVFDEHKKKDDLADSFLQALI